MVCVPESLFSVLLSLGSITLSLPLECLVLKSGCLCLFVTSDHGVSSDLLLRVVGHLANHRGNISFDCGRVVDGLTVWGGDSRGNLVAAVVVVEHFV